MVKIVKIPTAQSLASAALYYLERYAASEASLRRVLTNRLRRAALRIPSFAEDDACQEELRQSIETIIAKHKKLGIIDDAAFAAMKVGSFRRQGKSRRMIMQKLAQQGVAATHVCRALEDRAEGLSQDEADSRAACVLAKRRRFGVFRKKPGDDATYRKELAAMGRAGFSLDVARRALDGIEDA